MEIEYLNKLKPKAMYAFFIKEKGEISVKIGFYEKINTCKDKIRIWSGLDAYRNVEGYNQIINIDTIDSVNELSFDSLIDDKIGELE